MNTKKIKIFILFIIMALPMHGQGFKPYINNSTGDVEILKNVNPVIYIKLDGSILIDVYGNYKQEVVSYDSSAQALFTRMAALGEEPDAERKEVINNAIIRDKNANLMFSNCDCFYVLAAHDTLSSYLNFVQDTFNAQPIGGHTLNLDKGWNSNGTTGYLRTNYRPLSDAVKLSQNSASLVLKSNSFSFTSQYDIGAATSDVGTGLYINSNRSGTLYAGNNSSLVSKGSLGSNAVGTYILTRNASDSIKVYQNAVLFNSWAKASTALINNKIRMSCGSFNDTTPSNFSNRQYQLFGICNGFSQAQADSFQAIWVNYYLEAIKEQLPDLTFGIEPTGDRSGLATIKIEVTETTTMTVDHDSRFYDNLGGTVNPGTVRTITPGAIRTFYLKVPSDSGSHLVFSTTKVIRWGSFSGGDGWVSSTNMPTIRGNLNAFDSLVDVNIQGNNTLSFNISNQPQLQYYVSDGLFNGGGDLSEDTALIVFLPSGVSRHTGDVSALLHLQRLGAQGQNNITGNITPLTGLTNMSVTGINGLYATELKNLTNLTFLEWVSYRGVSGSLPPQLQVVSLNGDSLDNFRFNFDTLTDIQYFKTLDSVVITAFNSPHLNYINIQNSTTLDTATLINLLVQKWNDRDSAYYRVERNLDFKVRAYIEDGSLITLYADSLRNYRSPNNDPGNALWTVDIIQESIYQSFVYIFNRNGELDRNRWLMFIISMIFVFIPVYKKTGP